MRVFALVAGWSLFARRRRALGLLLLEQWTWSAAREIMGLSDHKITGYKLPLRLRPDEEEKREE